jgi:transcriptional regulator with XRE-family HTH domain
MSIGEKIRTLRKQKNWTQDELGEKVHIDGRRISRYENNRLKPARKVIKRFAEAFGISVEELLMGNGGQPEYLVHDKEILNLMQEIEEMDEEDRVHVKKYLETMVMKKQLRNLVVKRG